MYFYISLKYINFYLIITFDVRPFWPFWLFGCLETIPKHDQESWSKVQIQKVLLILSERS